MLLTASATFFGALIGIVALFTLRGFESSRGARVVPRFRAWLDRGALRLKAFLIRLQVLISMLPPLMAALSRLLFAAGARGFARLAHRSAETAHHLADFVSHKRNFERRPARSEFLRKIEEHKNGANGTSAGAPADVEIQA